MRDSVKVMILLSVSFLMVQLEQQLKGILPLSGLLAVMSTGIALYRLYRPVAERLSNRYNKLWVAAEVVLFVLVGASVDLRYAYMEGLRAVLLVAGALIFRITGVMLCLVKTKLSLKERVFCALAYIPKATVQAAIGGVPLAMGLSCGLKVLTTAVLAILITAPLGAVGIEHSYKKLLSKSQL